ncbi:MAG: hypothetical protein KDC05_07135 [Bacteroidales bacterium]|nr:hypothetical protein [Bacteroidales bacterium]
MKITWIKQFLAVLAGITMLISCEYEFIEVSGPKPPDPNDTTNPVDTILFSTQIEPIFDAASCTNCHNGGSLKPDLTAGNAYGSIISEGLVVPGDPEASIIYNYPNPYTGSHNTKYSNDQADLIYLWIFQGAMDN